MDKKEADKSEPSGVMESSMDVSSLNNLVVSMRPLFKKAKVHIIEALTRQRKKYAKRKGDEKQVVTYKKKVQTILEEIAAIKMLHIDRTAKFALANELPFEKLAAQGDIEKRALGRIATHSSVVRKVQEWRNNHDDWKALAAFMLSKNTGRRFKKKKTPTISAQTLQDKLVEKEGTLKKDALKDENKKHISSIPNVCQESTIIGNNAKTANISKNADKLLPKSLPNRSDRDIDGETDHSSSSESDEPGSPETTANAKNHGKNSTQGTETVVETKSYGKKSSQSAKSVAETKGHGKNSTSKDRKSAPIKSNTENTSDKNKEMVVKRLNLEQLSGDGNIVVSPDTKDESISFLFQSTPPVKERKKDTFFLDNSDSDAGSESARESDGDLEADGEHEEGSFIQKHEDSAAKSPNRPLKSMFVGTLSGIDEKRRFPEQKQRKDPRFRKGSSEDTWLNDISKQKQKRNTESKEEKRIRKENKTASLHSDPKTDFSREQYAEKLHPSWEASRKRKLQTSTLVEFQGKKITFDDD